MGKNALTTHVMKLLESAGVKEHLKYYAAKLLDSVLSRQISKTLSKRGDQLSIATKAEGKRVLFFTLQGRPNMLIVMAGLLGHSLNLRNAHSEIVVCDGQLPVCDLPFVTNNSKLVCKGCRWAARTLSGSLDLPVHFLSEFMDEQCVSEADAIVNNLRFEDYFTFEYLGVNIGKQAYASVLRYLLRGSIADDEYTRNICAKYMKSAVIMAKISKNIIAKLKPDCVVMHHGIYFTTGIFAEYARKHNVHTVVFTPAYRKHTYLFSHDGTYHKTLQDEPVERWERWSLSKEQGQVLDEYLDSRRWGSQDFISYHPNPLEDREQIIAELDLDRDKKTVGMFTNLCWDGQVVFHDTAFNNMFEWIVETIRYFIRKPELQLIIRIHPAEVKGAIETQQKVYPEIRKKFPHLPGNIRIVDSISDISTYTLSDLIDAAIVYTTKVGLEFSVRGIPVIVAGEAFYRNKGFTYDANSRSEYYSLLEKIPELEKNSDNLIARARQYAYYYFFRRFIPFDYTRNRTWNNVVGLKISGLEELLPGKNKYLDLICQGILEKKPFIIE